MNLLSSLYSLFQFLCTEAPYRNILPRLNFFQKKVLVSFSPFGKSRVTAMSTVLQFANACANTFLVSVTNFVDKVVKDFFINYGCP